MRIVCVHGTRLNRQQWARYPALLPGFDVVCPNLPGHGRQAGQAFTLHSALEAIGEAVGDTDQPVVLVGHSLGGYLAMEYAARFPERLSGLVPIGAGAVPHGIGADVYRGFASITAKVGGNRIAAITDPIVRRMIAPELYEQIRAEGMSYEALSASWEVVMSNAHPRKLAEVSAPVLFIAGQFDQLRIGTSRYLAHCRDPRSAVIGQATHFAPLTHPEPVAALVAAFATEVSRTLLR